jgi:Fic family protein
MPSASPQITHEILALISEIDEFKGRWQALKNLAPDRLTALRRTATIESVGSSTRIEGAKLSNHQVAKLLASLTRESFTTRDEQEVAGYARVMDLIFEAWETIPMTENYVKQLHSELLGFSEKDTRHRGDYKKHPNHVAAFDVHGNQLGIVFETSSPFDTPRQMEELVTWIQGVRKSRSFHPLIVIAIFIVRFLAIHPFQDGNGRLSRILTTLLLLQASYAYVPYSSLESIVEQNKEAYYLALRQTQLTLGDAKPDWEPWTVFFLNCLVAQTKRLTSKIETERTALASLTPLARTVTEMLETEARISVARIVAFTKVSRNTVKQTLSKLHKEGLIAQHGKGRGSFYTKP